MKIIKSIFITLLAFILVSLSLIAFKKIDKKDYLDDMVNLKDYRIIDNIEACEEKIIDCFYNANDTNYCLECMKSDEVILEWSDGSQTKMLDDLKNGKVTIESLISKGLKVTKE